MKKDKTMMSYKREIMDMKYNDMYRLGKRTRPEQVKVVLEGKEKLFSLLNCDSPKTVCQKKHFPTRLSESIEHWEN